MSVQLVDSSPPASNIPDKDGAVVAAGVQPVLLSVPGQTPDTPTVTLQYYQYHPSDPPDQAENVL